VEDETLSCGTGAVACAISLMDSGLSKCDKIDLLMRGGKLSVDLINDENTFSEIWLTGAVNMVFNGIYKFE